MPSEDERKGSIMDQLTNLKLGNVNCIESTIIKDIYISSIESPPKIHIGGLKQFFKRIQAFRNMKILISKNSVCKKTRWFFWVEFFIPLLTYGYNCVRIIKNALKFR